MKYFFFIKYCKFFPKINKEKLKIKTLKKNKNAQKS